MNTGTLAAIVLGTMLGISRACAADLPALQWHAGIAAKELQQARVIRIAPDFRKIDLAQLRDDQVIETPSGHRMLVRNLRVMQQAFAQAKARDTNGPVVPLKVLPRPAEPCTPLQSGETLPQILARPASEVVCLRSGRSASVAQLQALVPFMQRYHLGEQRGAAHAASPARTVAVQNGAAAMQQIRTAPDSTVLVDAHGNRATVGELKAFLAEHGHLLKASEPAPIGSKR